MLEFMKDHDAFNFGDKGRWARFDAVYDPVKVSRDTSKPRYPYHPDRMVSGVFNCRYKKVERFRDYEVIGKIGSI